MPYFGNNSGQNPHTASAGSYYFYSILSISKVPGLKKMGWQKMLPTHVFQNTEFLVAENIGRCERIRTFDPLHPMQVRYQAAPHTESGSNYNPPLTRP
jgi:hypothetical protein